MRWSNAEATSRRWHGAVHSARHVVHLQRLPGRRPGRDGLAFLPGSTALPFSAPFLLREEAPTASLSPTVRAQKNQTSGRQKHEPKHELHRKRKAPQVKHKNTFFRVEPLHFCLGNVFQDNSSSRWPIVDFGGALLVFGWVLRSTDHCSRNRFPSRRVAP